MSMNKKKKIVFLPLDERPCNYHFPIVLYGGEYELELPPFELMGRKKQPADTDAIAKWLVRNSAKADGIIIAADTLIYGGIIPSRLHRLDYKTLTKRLDIIRDVRKVAPKIPIYVFNLIMRCPQFSVNVEEPDYYGECGREIFLKGEALHKRELGLDTLGKKEFAEIEAKIPSDCYADFMGRREVNRRVNLAVIDLLRDGVIDMLLIPQDDSAEFGHTAKDQSFVRQYVKQNKLQDKVYMYPGADETGLTLLARMINNFYGKRPKVFVMYSSRNGGEAVPVFEDRPVAETIKYQLLAAGCLRWENPDTADIILAVNPPPHAANETERTIIEFCELAEEFVRMDKPVAIADTAGGEDHLRPVFEQKKLLMKLAGYAAWNTSSNTLGTCISQAVKFLHEGATANHKNFMALRLVEDIGYCTVVRKDVQENVLPRLGLHKYNVDGERGEVSKIIKKKLEEFVASHLPSLSKNIFVHDCLLPWNRTFEAGLEVEYKDTDKP